MGLFVQNISLRMSDKGYLIEKVELPQLNKGKIDLVVAPGTIAYVGGVKYKGSKAPYKITREVVGAKKSSTDAYLVADKPFESISVQFFGGQHVVSISSLPTAKAKFSIVGTANVEVSEYKDLAAYFGRSITRDDLVAEINANFRAHLTNEVSAAASRYITADTTEVSLNVALDNVANDVMKSRKTVSMLVNMGLILSARGISMHLNALDGTDDKLRLINDALTCKALSSLDDDMLDRQERELAAARQHEIDLIRAQRTDINESTETKNINTNTSGNGKVVINPPAGANNKHYCPNCGAEVAAKAKFCPDCGQKL